MVIAGETDRISGGRAGRTRGVAYRIFAMVGSALTLILVLSCTERERTEAVRPELPTSAGPPSTKKDSREREQTVREIKGRLRTLRYSRDPSGDAQDAGASEEQRARVLSRAEPLFDAYCAECHGWWGDGDGLRSDLTYARPRNFLLGQFKLTTTENQVPSDADLMRTIREGLPGSGMPNWEYLPEEEIADLAFYVRNLSIEAIIGELAEQVAGGGLTAEAAGEILEERTVPGPPIVVPPEPEFAPQGRERGRRIFLEACADCHGTHGETPWGNLKTDFEGNLLLPTSLVTGVFKGGAEGAQLYARILKGMSGTAMPAYEDTYTADELWDLIHYVQSLARPASD